MRRLWMGLGLAAGLAMAASAGGLERGTWELSGMGAWSLTDDSGPGPNTFSTDLTLSPAVVAYPSRYLFLGPLLDYSRSRTETENATGMPGTETVATRWDMGLQAGLLANWSGERFRPLPYLGASVGLSAMSLDIDVAEGSGVFGDDSRLADNGHFFGVFLGGKLRLTESMYLNLQPTLTFAFIGQREVVDLSVRTGFSGAF